MSGSSDGGGRDIVGRTAVGYVRFILLSHLRSGTHFLRSSLESHPEIVCQTELFNANARTLPYPLSTPTAEILDRWGFPPRPPGVRASGFVIHAYHPGTLRAFPWLRPNPAWDDVWDRLAAMPDLRVVALERRDLLRRHLSQLVADRTRRWHAWDPGRVGAVTHLGAPPPDDQVGPPRPDPEPIVVDVARMLTDFEEVEACRRRARARLAGQPAIEVTYEELCADYGAVCARVQSFLGVEPRALTPALVKLERRPLADAIANWRDVRERLRGTRWAALAERADPDG